MMEEVDPMKIMLPLPAFAIVVTLDLPTRNAPKQLCLQALSKAGAETSTSLSSGEFL